MNPTLTTTELLELKLLVSRLEAESNDRDNVLTVTGGTIVRLTDRSRDALRMLPALKKLISMVGET